jgi:hypothetical protein
MPYIRNRESTQAIFVIEKVRGPTFDIEVRMPYIRNRECTQAYIRHSFAGLYLTQNVTGLYTA